VIEPRIYRAAFVPALLAVVLTMFSFESRPRPVPQGLAADVLFDGNQAAVLANRIASEAPDRLAARAAIAPPRRSLPTPSPPEGLAAAGVHVRSCSGSATRATSS
jgi:hypothetical protein